MTPLGTVRMIAGREIRTRMLTKGSVWSMAVLVALIVGALVVTSYLLGRNNGEEAGRLAVVHETEPVGRALVDALGAGFPPTALDLHTVDTAEEARTQVTDEESVAALVVSDDRLTLYTGPDTPASLTSIAQTIATERTMDQAITDLGGDPAQVRAEVAQNSLDVFAVEQAEEWDVATFVVAMAILALMFYLIVSTGSTLATGVIEEKSSRIVEILLATVRPWQLLAGKVIGIGMVGFVQVAVVLSAALITATATGLIDSITVPLGEALFWSILWMVLGFLLFSVLWAGAAALVSRQEEVGYVTGPLMMLVFIPFYATMFVVVNNPTGIVSQILTFVPFSAPFAAPVRFAYGGIGLGQMVLSAGICVAAIVVCVFVAGRIYEHGVLHSGGRLSLRRALTS